MDDKVFNYLEYVDYRKLLQLWFLAYLQGETDNYWKLENELNRRGL